MDTKVTDKYLTAILYLMTELQNWKIGIDSNMPVTYDADIKNKIISEITDEFGIDYNSLKKNEIIKYESFLSKYLTRYLNTKKQESFDKQYEFINSTKLISKEQFKLSDKFILENKPHINEHLKKLGISKSGIASWFLNPDFISLLKTVSSEHYFCSKRIKIKGIEKILLYHFSYNPELKGLEIHSLFVLNERKKYFLASNPSRAFLFLISKYGNEIKVDNHFEKGIFFSNKNPASEIQVQLKKQKHEIWGFIEGIKFKKNGIYFAYSIDVTEYMIDYKKYDI